MSSSTVSAGPLAAPPPGGPGGAVRLRQVAHASGEVLITLGVVLLLFVAYLLFWTNLTSDAAARTLTDNLRQRWDAPHAGGPAIPGPSSPSHQIPAGAFAIMTIPRLGATWSSPVIEPKGKDISLDELADGVVHYKGTALPGQAGNFAVAGHRATHGHPFSDLDLLRPGDLVVVETADAFYTYTLDNDPNGTIVLPTDVWVLDPVPGKPKAKPTQALITLTTCNPRWNSSHRMIAFGHLTSTRYK